MYHNRLYDFLCCHNGCHEVSNCCCHLIIGDMYSGTSEIGKTALSLVERLSHIISDVIGITPSYSLFAHAQINGDVST